MRFLLILYEHQVHVGNYEFLVTADMWFLFDLVWAPDKRLDDRYFFLKPTTFGLHYSTAYGLPMWTKALYNEHCYDEGTST